ncbi:MAG TPA: sugar ABC transporter permease [Candidatus Faecivivens stercoravium]|uniref:Sugar ABC transporter permease n=1 Tax=Candidatus Faecivivens stercoravium TaxID=2840803 RepID=A0A9D1DYB6_9FIRM|nr:sugar ABC transporter permease [Candidatus Faecivivens stercoravium]
MTKQLSPAEKAKATSERRRLIRRDWKMNKAVYLMAVPVIVYFFIFNYIPMGGILMAFEDYSIKKGIFGSTFVGFDNFIRFFNSIYCWRVIRNTLLISLYGLLFSFPFPIIFALCLNEIRNTKFKKLTQTISYLPYFISIVVVVSILQDFTSADGVLTQLAAALGDTGGALWSRPEWFRTLYIGSNIWQHLGYNSIIFISALAAIDQELYEAAVIDGAGRWKQTLYITLPELSSTIVVLLILRLGQIMNVGYEKTILMYSPATYETADVIASYVYRVGIEDADYGYSTAINFFNSVVNFLVLFVANAISRKLSETSLW